MKISVLFATRSTEMKEEAQDKRNDIRHYLQLLVETHRIINAPTLSVMNSSVDWLRVVREFDV